MIQGHVEGLQAKVGVVLRLPTGSDIAIEFVVDTGFEGALTMPPAQVAALELPFFQEMNANLANDQTVSTDVHTATILWDGREVDVVVLAMGRRPLLGTALLAGKALNTQFVDQGLVMIEDL